MGPHLEQRMRPLFFGKEGGAKDVELWLVWADLGQDNWQE